MPRSRIVGVEGGTESPVWLASRWDVEEIEASAVVHVADEGGSSACGIKRW